ncbi:MAG: 1-deoxy-D-xylulose-5-phosphate synthase [Actinobacteria bacterium]|nr:1-deoxy-D-xylulose-5-phosphate synthase [Actinomycetota bacterium]
MDNKILNNINSPSDLKNLSPSQLKILADEIREKIIKTVSETGGHLAPSLGVVELTIGLHLALDSPKDKIIWDVGHQSYAHKIITGRREQFNTLRQYGGISGFPKRSESDHDIFDTGHSSTSISAALGLAEARDIKNEKDTIVAVIGDGSLTGGMAYEALNQAGHLKTDLIVVLNDNVMSISPNVGAMSLYLNRIRLDPAFKKVREKIEQQIQKIPNIGPKMITMGELLEDSVKHLFVPGMIFEELGFKYIGPVDGHDIEAVVKSINFAKQLGGPILIHTLTKKGFGYPPAEQNPDKFHGTNPFVIETGKAKKKIMAPSYTDVFGDALIRIAEKKDNVIAITAAMKDGTGLNKFAKRFPDRFYDVGIAEQHAVTFAAGLSLKGFCPVVAIYSTFLQRALDQIIHDVCLQNLHVVFALDRAGLVGEDGATHHGAFDISYLRHLPNITIMAPKDEEEFCDMIYTAVQMEGPVAIRYPRGSAVGVRLTDEFKLIKTVKAEIIQRGKDVCIIAVGRMVQTAIRTSNELVKKGITSSIINARFIKPIDEHLISLTAPQHKLVVTIEENVLTGGFGSGIMELLNENNISIPVLRFGLPDKFIEHGPVDLLLSDIGLDAPKIASQISERLNKMEKKFQIVRGIKSRVSKIGYKKN